MKALLPTGLAGLLLLTVAASAAKETPAHTVMIDADIISANSKKAKGGARESGKQLAVTVTRLSKDVTGDLKVKWFLFGTDVKDHDKALLGSGEATLNLGEANSASLTNDTVNVAYTPAKTTGRGRTRKVTPASGNRASGYGVQVFKDGTLLGEVFNPAELKKEADTAVAPKKQEPKKKK